MFEILLNIVCQVSATLLLGAFFGLERRMRGYPDASRLHAIVAAIGLMAIILFRPEAAPVVTTMVVTCGLSFLSVAGFRMLLQALANSRTMFAASGADTFTLAGALMVGCACGTGDVRSVAAVMVFMALVSIFRPLENYAGEVLSRGDVDAPELSQASLVAVASNDKNAAQVQSLDSKGGQDRRESQ